MLGFQPLQEQSSLCFFVCSADAIYSLTAVFAFHQMLWKLEKKDVSPKARAVSPWMV